MLFCLYKQKLAVDILRNNSTSSNDKAGALLSSFISTTDLSTSSDNTSGILTLLDIDTYIDELNDTIKIRSNTSFIKAQPTRTEDDTVLGGSLELRMNNQIVKNTNKVYVTSSNISAVAIFSDKSVNNIAFITVFILGDPTAYRNLDKSGKQRLVSPVIIVGARENKPQSSIDISLYFKILPEYNPNITDANYSCSFYDTNTSQWNQSDCSKPQYNETFDRYECNCNHLTSFALICLPNTPPQLDAQDITSLIFLSISILCFIAVIIHSLTIRLLNPLMPIRALDLLPLISSASTTILFIFYIALSMTVYTRTSMPIPHQCFRSASVLMFFVYFYLIFMFCVKTSIGYFNYLRFVHLFPEPSHRKLFLMLIISFFISITLVSFADGFNSNPSYKITQLHKNKLCWFTRDVINYFLTIPVCVFLRLNFITIIVVSKHIINPVQNASSPYQLYERTKRCVLVLLSSCITQGIGWLFGPFLSFVDPAAVNVLGWFFIIFNGLEGVWTILLYIIIRSQHIDEQLRIKASRDLRKTTRIYPIKSEKENKSNLNSIVSRGFKNTPKCKKRMVDS